MPEADADLNLLLEAAEAAGRIAAKYFRKDPETWDKGDGQGPVTQADLEIDTMLREELLSARPDYGWLSEETEDDPKRLEHENVFIVDPIDGTRAFVEGRETFSHALAVAHKGQINAAVVHLHLRGKTYSALRGAGAQLNGVPMKVGSCEEVNDADVLAGKWNAEAQHWRGGVPGFTRHMRSSLAYRMGLVAEGRFDAMLTLRRTWEWDVAAGTLLVDEAGGVVTDWSGNSPKFNAPSASLDGMIAAGCTLHSNLLDQLVPHSAPIAAP